MVVVVVVVVVVDAGQRCLVPIHADAHPVVVDARPMIVVVDCCC